MIFKGIHNDIYTTGRELGRGGEGTVYDLQHAGGLVLKCYNDPLTPEKTAKLQRMIAIRSAAIEAYAAWPVDLVSDETGRMAGFVMRKLAGYVPLHRVFSPLERKKLFPDKGYNFLIHIARNLATAFHQLHEAGLITGDVNEGNILINPSGLVAFIDCDSFQVPDGAGYYFCEVGVPRYTPPELLKLGSFEHVVRTVNTDSFSLAILVFQLLFLGRHPFAGKNKLAADFDEETAIRKREFAYSLYNKRKKLFPPDDSFEITNLNPELVALFHQAFEQDDRPVPADWVRALDDQLRDMVTCSVSRIHTYPAGMAECPWCYYQARRGIRYFLDDSYLQAAATLGDIDSFVNGFRIEKLELKKWEGRPDYSGIEPTPADPRFGRYRTYKWASICCLVTFAIVVFTIHMNPVFAVAAVLLSYVVYQYSGWTVKLNAELNNRSVLHRQLQQGVAAAIREYDQPADYATYTRGLDTLQRYVSDFRRLPEELDRRRKLMEESVYNEQLDEYLQQYDIDRFEIPSIGAARKTALANCGIRTAADVARLSTIKVPGIGPKNIQLLLSWQRQMATGFVYIPRQALLAERMQDVNHEVATIRARLENLIRREYQSLNYLRLNITNRASILERQIQELLLREYRARLELEAFRRLAA